MKKTIYCAYTDGSRQKVNMPDLGSWAFIVTKNGMIVHVEAGVEYENENKSVTNIGMELKALMECLKYFKKNIKSNIKKIIYTDSIYLVKIYSGEYNATSHAEIWKYILEDLAHENIAVMWVKGHADCIGNIVADKMTKIVLKSII